MAGLAAVVVTFAGHRQTTDLPLPCHAASRPHRCQGAPPLFPPPPPLVSVHNSNAMHRRPLHGLRRQRASTCPDTCWMNVSDSSLRILPFGGVAWLGAGRRAVAGCLHGFEAKVDVSMEGRPRGLPGGAAPWPGAVAATSYLAIAFCLS